MANSDVELKEVVIESLLKSVEEGRKRGNHLQPSIFMVPGIYRDQNPKCFNPQVVSIGPLHRGHENLQKNDGLKNAYMHDLLDRLNSPSQQTLESCFSKVNSRINEIRSCYGGMNNDHDFDVARMMVTDACFILEFIQKISEEDPVLCMGNKFTANSISTDLLLIENQIPFFVLQDIFDLTLIEVQKNNSLTTLLLEMVLSHFKPFEAKLKIDNNGTEVYNFKHILEILHKSCVPDGVLPKYYYGSLGMIRSKNSVAELDPGVKFKPNLSRNMEMALEYKSFGWLWIMGRPTLRMPVLTIDYKTELVFRNLIAYEQSYPYIDGQYFTSLALTLDNLVDSTEDVAKLVESGVIVDYLGSNRNTANMIKSICHEIVSVRFSYGMQLEHLYCHYHSYWPKHMALLRKYMASLRRTYFNSPWNAMALVATILVFALTAIQTIFTVMSA